MINFVLFIVYYILISFTLGFFVGIGYSIGVVSERFYMSLIHYGQVNQMLQILAFIITIGSVVFLSRRMYFSFKKAPEKGGENKK